MRLPSGVGQRDGGQGKRDENIRPRRGTKRERKGVSRAERIWEVGDRLVLDMLGVRWN